MGIVSTIKSNFSFWSYSVFYSFVGIDLAANVRTLINCQSEMKNPIKMSSPYTQTRSLFLLFADGKI